VREYAGQENAFSTASGAMAKTSQAETPTTCFPANHQVIRAKSIRSPGQPQLTGASPIQDWLAAAANMTGRPEDDFEVAVCY
jgi:hypothetical protein